MKKLRKFELDTRVPNDMLNSRYNIEVKRSKVYVTKRKRRKVQAQHATEMNNKGHTTFKFRGYVFLINNHLPKMHS